MYWLTYLFRGTVTITADASTLRRHLAFKHEVRGVLPFRQSFCCRHPRFVFLERISQMVFKVQFHLEATKRHSWAKEIRYTSWAPGNAWPPSTRAPYKREDCAVLGCTFPTSRSWVAYWDWPGVLCRLLLTVLNVLSYITANTSLRKHKVQEHDQCRIPGNW